MAPLNYGNPFHDSPLNLDNQQKAQTLEPKPLSIDEIRQVAPEHCCAPLDCLLHDFSKHPGFSFFMLIASLLLFSGMLFKYTTNEGNPSKSTGTNLIYGSVFSMMASLFARLYSSYRLGEEEHAKIQGTKKNVDPDESTMLINLDE